MRPRTWRTNIGLRLEGEVGEWLVEHCERENRTMANFVELLILKERIRLLSLNTGARSE